MRGLLAWLVLLTVLVTLLVVFAAAARWETLAIVLGVGALTAGAVLALLRRPR